MAVIQDKVQIGSTSNFLDGVSVNTPAGTDLFRETVVVADPEDGGGLANVRQLSTDLVSTDRGIVTNTVIHGLTTAGHGAYVDVKVTPSGAIVADVTGSSVTANIGSLNGAATEAKQLPDNHKVTVSNLPLDPLTGANSSVAASVTAVTLLASNGARRGATVYNDSTSSLRLSLGNVVTDTSFTLIVAGGGYYEVPFGYRGAITGLWAAAIGAARVTELT